MPGWQGPVVERREAVRANAARLLPSSAKVADSCTQMPHPFVQGTLVGVLLIEGEGQHSHKAISSASTPAPAIRWLATTLAAPRDRLRQAGISRRAG